MHHTVGKESEQPTVHEKGLKDGEKKKEYYDQSPTLILEDRKQPGYGTILNK